MDTPSSSLGTGVGNMKIKDEPADSTDDHQKLNPASRHVKTEPSPTTSAQHTPPLERTHSSDVKKMPKEEVIGAEIILKNEPGQPPKLSRKSSQKVVQRPAELFTDWPDATKEATSVFEVIKDCTYANRNMGYTEPPLECDCAEEWDSATQTNNACDEHSDCINRATKMECAGDCGCGNECQNQRFTRKQWANVSVIKTDKKGYGLRTDADLQPHDFIFEYVGEVIGEGAFRKRTIQYDDQGIKHFYFMSLNKGEFIDATRKGNLGRFCNHSCNPNCYVDKWVVGEKLRMGIFAERAIKAGEELVFNYNVDRYGADPQPCYCGEPNCVGFIGGKTQSGKSNSKLSAAVVEALGLDDADDWNDAIVKPIRKRKTEEDDSEYVSNVQPRLLEEDGVAKVMAELQLTKEKWIAVKLLSRIQRADDERVRLRVLRFHGYRMLNNAMKTFIDDDNILLQILDILSRFPRLTRNKIHDSGIETTMEKLKESENEVLKAQATTLLDEWSKLEMGFRIKKLKRDPATLAEEKRIERLRIERERQEAAVEKAAAAAARPAAPTGPKAMFRGPPPRAYRPPPGPLPMGWFEKREPDGSAYYWNASGEAVRRRPTAPAPPAPPKAASDREVLQNLINKIVSEKKSDEAPPQSTTNGQEVSDRAKDTSREEKWKSFSEEKKKKIYENILFPHVSYVMNKYKKYFARDVLKKHGKTIAKKMVDSDFKHNRVANPKAKLTAKQEKAVKDNTKAYFDKAVKKQKEADRESKSKKPDADTAPKARPISDATPAPESKDAGAADDVQLSDNEVDIDGDDDADTPQSAPKRRRDDDGLLLDVESDAKRSRLSEENTPTPSGLDPSMIPPPPPPPLDGFEEDGESVDVQMDDVGTPSTALDSAHDKGKAVHHTIAPDAKSSVTNEVTHLVTPPTTDSTNGAQDHEQSARRDQS